MSLNGIRKVLAVAKKVQLNNPEILQPLADFFNIDIDERLNNPTSLEGLSYTSY